MSSHELSGIVAMAERLTIATILAVPSAWSRAGHLTPSDFADPVLGEIYGAAAEVVEDGDDPDPISVGSKLANGGKLERCGGYQGLSALASEGEGRDVGAYVWRVDCGSRMRTAVRIVQRMTEHIERAHLEDAPQLMSRLSDLLLQAEQKPDSGDRMRRLSDAIDEVVTWMQKRTEAPDKPLGVPTGFACLDERWSTLQPSCFYVLAARPKMGKTALAANIAMAGAASGDGAVAYFSAEVSTFKLALRTVANVSGVGQQQIQHGRVAFGEIAEVMRAKGEMRQWASRFWLDDSHAQSSVTIRRALRRLVQREGRLRLVIVDHMHLLKPARAHNSDEGEMADIANGLLDIAKEFRVPVLALAQLNRQCEGRPDKRPTPSDVRASGAIEQNADVLAFLYRDEVYNKNTDEPGVCEVITALIRDGVPGTDKLRWDGRTQRFSETLVPPPEDHARTAGVAHPWNEPPEREPGWWHGREQP